MGQPLRGRADPARSLAWRPLHVNPRGKFPAVDLKTKRSDPDVRNTEESYQSAKEYNKTEDSKNLSFRPEQMRPPLF